MPDLRPVPAVTPTSVDESDLEAVTAARINLLVARTKMWRGENRMRAEREEPVEVAAS